MFTTRYPTPISITFYRKEGSFETLGDAERYNVIVKISCTGTNITDCYLWNMAQGPKPTAATDLKESLITTKQWYMLRATYRYVYHGQRLMSEFAIVSMSNPTFALYLFNDDIAKAIGVTVVPL